MAFSLEPTHTAAVSGQLSMLEAQFAAVIGSSAARAMPVPWAGDSVTAGLAFAFGPEYAPRFFQTTVDGCSKFTGGRHEIPAVVAEYTAGDLAGGGAVGSHTLSFMQ